MTTARCPVVAPRVKSSSSIRWGRTERPDRKQGPLEPIRTPYLGVNVTLTTASIPEFMYIAIPIVSIISIFAVRSRASGCSREE